MISHHFLWRAFHGAGRKKDILVQGSGIEIYGTGGLAPDPPGIYRVLTCSCEGLIKRAIGARPTLAFARLQIGAGVQPLGEIQQGA